MKEIVSIGKIEELKIPTDLVYRRAIEQLVKDATGTGITIDLASFYSLEPVKLHNFVDTITYRFVKEDEEEFLVYCVVSRPNEIYREVAFDGSVTVSNINDIEISTSSYSTEQDVNRMKKYLGI